MAALRGWYSLNENECFSPTSKSDFYRRAKYVGIHSFSLNINQIRSIILELNVYDDFGNCKTFPYGVALKSLKPSEVQQQYPVQKMKRVRQSDGTWKYVIPKV